MVAVQSPKRRSFMNVPSFRSRSSSPERVAKLAKMLSFGKSSSPKKDASFVSMHRRLASFGKMPSFGNSSSPQKDVSVVSMPSFGKSSSPPSDAKKISSAEMQAESYLATAEVAIRQTVLDDSMKDLETIALRDAEEREREALTVDLDAVRTENLAREAARLQRARNAKRKGLFVCLMMVGLAVAFHWFVIAASPPSAVEAPPRRHIWLK